MGIVVIGGGGGGGTQPQRVSGSEVLDSEGQTVAVFPPTAKGRKDCIRYLRMIQREQGEIGAED
jgi:hypothetical protein